MKSRHDYLKLIASMSTSEVKILEAALKKQGTSVAEIVSQFKEGDNIDYYIDEVLNIKSDYCSDSKKIKIANNLFHLYKGQPTVDMLLLVNLKNQKKVIDGIDNPKKVLQTIMTFGIKTNKETLTALINSTKLSQHKGLLDYCLGESSLTIENKKNIYSKLNEEEKGITFRSSLRSKNKMVDFLNFEDKSFDWLTYFMKNLKNIYPPVEVIEMIYHKFSKKDKLKVKKNYKDDDMFQDWLIKTEIEKERETLSVQLKAPLNGKKFKI